MFKQVILPILAVVAFIIVVGVLIQKSSSLGLSRLFMPQPTSVPEKTVTINTAKISVQIADTKEKRVKGLSGVNSLPEDGGMLFVFESKGVTTLFWMKDMLIPLDIIWIGDGKVIKIDKNVPIPPTGYRDANIKTYSPGQPIDYVLEVNAGFSDKNKIKVGDTVDLSRI